MTQRRRSRLCGAQDQLRLACKALREGGREQAHLEAAEKARLTEANEARLRWSRRTGPSRVALRTPSRSSGLRLAKEAMTRVRGRRERGERRRRAEVGPDTSRLVASGRGSRQLRCACRGALCACAPSSQPRAPPLSTRPPPSPPSLDKPTQPRPRPLRLQRAHQHLQSRQEARPWSRRILQTPSPSRSRSQPL